jgi:hypothetical protein
LNAAVLPVADIDSSRFIHSYAFGSIELAVACAFAAPAFDILSR